MPGCSPVPASGAAPSRVLGYERLALADPPDGAEFVGRATVWSSDTQRAYEVACRIDSGCIWVNKHLDMPPDVPFGGAKQSGLGAEMGQEGLEEFTQSRIINVAR